MSKPKLTKLELQIMEALWSRGSASIREIQESFPEKARPAYTTIQTTVYRLEGKKAVGRVRKVGNFHVFEAAVSRDAAQRKLIDDLLVLFAEHAARHGALDRIRQTYAGRREGSRESPAEARQKGQIEMIVNSFSGMCRAIAPALGNHLWQSTLFAIAAGLLTLILRNNYARTRYLLWLTASLKFLIPFSTLVSAGN